VNGGEMIKLELFNLKAKERLKVAEYCYEKGYYYACASNLYFSIFNFMYAVLGEPEEDKGWRHLGIARAFGTYCNTNDFFDVRKVRYIRNVYEKLYKLRRSSDYHNIEMGNESIEELKTYINFLKGVYKDAV
jgi:uncharacterized protein (UPF0332 family)